MYHSLDKTVLIRTSAKLLLARFATSSLFFFFGISVAAWVSGVPGLKHVYELDDAQLGLTLFCAGIASIIMAWPNAKLIAKFGTKRVGIIAVISGTCCSVTLPYWAKKHVAPYPIVLINNILSSGFYASFTVKATELEQLLGHSVMSSFHACFSLGTLVGSTIFSALLMNGYSWSDIFPLQVAFAGICIFTTLLFLPNSHSRIYPAREIFNTSILDSPTDIINSPGRLFAYHNQESNKPSRFCWRVFTLALVSSLAMFTEASIGDWGGLYFMRYGNATLPEAPLLYSAFACAMIPARLFGDMAVNKLGRKRIFFSGGLMSLIGFAALLAFPQYRLLVFVSAAAIGLGLANNVPIIQSCAGMSNKMSIPEVTALLSAMNSAAMLGGPSFIGPISRRYGLHKALCLPLCATVVIAISYRALDVNKSVLSNALEVKINE